MAEEEKETCVICEKEKIDNFTIYCQYCYTTSPFNNMVKLDNMVKLAKRIKALEEKLSEKN